MLQPTRRDGQRDGRLRAAADVSSVFFLFPAKTKSNSAENDRSASAMDRGLFTARLVGDASLTLGMLGGALVMELLARSDMRGESVAVEHDDEAGVSYARRDRRCQMHRRLLPCDSAMVGPYRRGIARTSDALAALAIGLPMALVAVAARSGPGTGSGEWRTTVALVDAVVVTQSIAAALLLAQIAKLSVRRDRPYARYDALRYDDAPRLAHDIDATRSFFSAHTAASFAASVGVIATLSQHTDVRPVSPALWYATCVSVGLAIATGSSRCFAAMHYISDVCVGTVVGSCVALAVAWLH